MTTVRFEPHQQVPRHEQGGGRRWLALFRQFDTEGRGKIPMRLLRERVEAAGQQTGITPKEREILLAGADKNAHRKINFQEFCELMAKAKRMHVHRLMFAAAGIVVPKEQREEEFSYLSEYNGVPPPFMLLISFAQIVVYCYYASMDESGDKKSLLVFDTDKKEQVWRYLTCMFVHLGLLHLIGNVLTQLSIGLPLELVHRFLRIAIIYCSGVIGAALAVGVIDLKGVGAGASGGVYALIGAHLMLFVMNFGEMEIPWNIFFMIVGTVVETVYQQYGTDEVEKYKLQLSFLGHFGGFLAGLILGVLMLRNVRLRVWQRSIWWVCLCTLFLLLAITVRLNMLPK